MQRVASQVLIGAIFAVLLLAAVPTPAAAHDPGCLASAHLGSVKAHVNCDAKNRNDDSDCLASFNVGPVHDDILCD